MSELGALIIGIGALAFPLALVIHLYQERKRGKK
jgi:multisubunit Na+/H+ antiporter MnhC subunit